MAILRKRKETLEQESDTDSISDSASEILAKPKNRRPKENAFTQQKLKAYNPILTPKTVIPIFFILAIIFIPLGAGMLYGSAKVEEIIIDYEQCENLASDDYYSDIPTEYYSYSFHEELTITPKWKYGTNSSETDSDEAGLCYIQFQIPDDIGPPVEDQLNGLAASLTDIEDTTGQNCQPLSHNDDGQRYYPCGLIANAMFNDTFSIPAAVNDTTDDYDMTEDGIAWSTDSNRFKKTEYSASEVVPPPNWVKKFPDGYTDDNLPDISTWYQFQNWMHTPGLPNFSKMVLRNDDDTFPAGTYEITVGLHFPVTEYDGTKGIYISTRSVIGGKNSFLGISWIVAGGICFILALVFVAIHNLHPRKTGDLSFLSWNKEEKAIHLDEDSPERVII
ncbi:hypothetical protein PACTADRAFT_48648 [Pachysolen tannophilus NRRL Y-2460]|uniref:Cell division control protein 50 n=1 Tax=Pachysolen tannophilus NRRL Y-2460 TaxID=669874 RepID=A0A1E4TYK7_PACTA|nr:hypothetical protein PACTADRAFT_48648 [Pachysolen tannophilus NRRL Y-2460]